MITSDGSPGLRRWSVVVSISGALLGFTAFPQEQASTGSIGGLDLVAEIRRRAETGDPQAQLSLGKGFEVQKRSADALHWYARAAARGNMEGAHNAGKLLLLGAPGNPPDQQVIAMPEQGLQWVLWAATNRYVPAYETMHRAYLEGLGTPKDPVRACAWLELHLNTTSEPKEAGAQKLNRLATELGEASYEEAKRLAASYAAGQWTGSAPTNRPAQPVAVQPKPATPPGPPPATTQAQPNPSVPVAAPAAQPERPAAVAPRPDLGLKLNGILSGSKAVAVINGKGVSEGESATFTTPQGTFTIKCLKVDREGVQLRVEGEDSPRLLHMK